KALPEKRPAPRPIKRRHLLRTSRLEPMPRTSTSGADRAAVAVPPEESARRAGLRYVRDDAPGYRRRRCGRGFTYVDPDGGFVREAAARARGGARVTPPARTRPWSSAP